MINLSMPQALEIWSMLEAAYHKKDGTITEDIFVYQLLSYIPGGEPDEDDTFQAAASLTNLLDHFCVTHCCNVEVWVDGNVKHVARIRSDRRGGSVAPFNKKANVRVWKG